MQRKQPLYQGEEDKGDDATLSEGQQWMRSLSYRYLGVHITEAQTSPA